MIARVNESAADRLVAERVERCATEAIERWDKPRARSMRRAFALGYWCGDADVSFHIDADQFAARVDWASYARLTAIK